MGGGGGLGLSDSSVELELLGDQNDGKISISSMVFKNLNRKVASVFIQPDFNKREQLEVHILWTDESDVRESNIPSLGKKLCKHLPAQENHIAVQTVGNVSELEILFSEPLLLEELPRAAINRQIPFYFSGLRLIVVSLLFFAVIMLVYKPLRAKAAYYLFEYKFDPSNKKQSLVYACLVILTLLFSWACVYTSDMGDMSNNPMNTQYHRYLVDAFIDGRINISYGHPEKLLGEERPYNKDWLWRHDIKSNTDIASDIAYYKGKFYVYYGAVPALLLYVPYKLVTGNYMSNHGGVFAFAVAAVVFLAALWRFLVKKYMPDARFAFVLLSFSALFFVSHLFAVIRYPSVWAIVQIGGFAFVVAGTFLLLKSVDSEKTNRLRLFFGCLCLALAVGCRPNTVLASALVPVVLWRRRSWRLALFALIPYAMVALPLMLYNYARFESIFQFGHDYCIGYRNISAAHLLNPLGKMHRMFVIAAFYLFRLYRYTLHFPFVELLPPGGNTTRAFGFVWGYNSSGGLINFPILFCVFYLFKKSLGKNKPDGFRLSSACLIIAAAMILSYSKMGIFHGRYLLDCAIFFILPSLFCAYWWCGDERRDGRRLKIVYALLAVSIFVGLFRFVSGSDHGDGIQWHNPALYRYLECSLGIIGRF